MLKLQSGSQLSGLLVPVPRVTLGAQVARSVQNTTSKDSNMLPVLCSATILLLVKSYGHSRVETGRDDRFPIKLAHHLGQINSLLHLRARVNTHANICWGSR
jgi:hypothetical protein